MRGPFHLEIPLKKNTTTAADAAVGEASALPEHALQDEYAGRGGSYVYDPARDIRVPANDVTQRPAAEGVKGNE